MRSCDILQQCNDLKDRIIVDDEINWEIRNKLQQLLEKVLLSDVDYGVSKQGEQLLWNSCFKSCIDFYQTKLRDRKTDDNAAFLSMFLTSSVGFFAQFLSKLCRYYQINPDFLKSDAYFGILNGHWDKRRRAAKKNLIYLAQFCLIHLGDLARYQKRLNVAETFYLNARNICPKNGHPFNQLAILETSRNRNLSAIYLYTRSLYVENSFSLASTNLDKFYFTVDLKLQTQSYIDKFFKFMSVVHLMTPENLNFTENEFLKPILFDLKSAATDFLNYDDFFHIFIIALGGAWKINPSDEIVTSFDDFSTDEKRCLKFLLEFLENFFVHVIEKNFSGLIYLCSIWFKIYSNLIVSDGFCGAESRFLPVLTKYLNFNKLTGENFTKNEFSDVILPEEREIRGFLPLQSAFRDNSGDFLENSSIEYDENYFNVVRTRRLTDFGKFLANLLKNDELLSVNEKISTENGENCLEFSTKVAFVETVDLKKPVIEEKSVKFKEEITEEKSAEHSKISKRQTKVLPLLTIFERERVKEENETTKNEQPPKIKIAPPGSKVELPLAPEKKIDEEEEKPSAENAEQPATTVQQQEKSRYELPPRFQAAKLKHALTGGAPPFGNFDRRMPPEPNVNLAAFPPLVPPPWGAAGAPPPEFHKTPGVRPRGPPSFPFPAPPGFPPGRLPPPPFGAPKLDMVTANPNTNNNRPPPPLWSAAQNSLFLNQDDHYFNMWQPKTSANPNPARNEEIWKRPTFNWSGVRPPNAADMPLPPQSFFRNVQQQEMFAPQPPTFGTGQYPYPYPNPSNSGDSRETSSLDVDKIERKENDGQFTLFGSGNFLEYAKWSSGNDD